MRAEITYNGGKSCTIKATKFVEGVTRMVTDPDIIENCQRTHGFAVHMLRPEKQVVVPVADEEAPALKSPAKKVKHQ